MYRSNTLGEERSHGVSTYGGLSVWVSLMADNSIPSVHSGEVLSVYGIKLFLIGPRRTGTSQCFTPHGRALVRYGLAPLQPKVAD